jgi:hypothetical protein
MHIYQLLRVMAQVQPVESEGTCPVYRGDQRHLLNQRFERGIA